MTVLTVLLAIVLLAGISVAIAVAGAGALLGLARLERSHSLVPAPVRSRERRSARG